MIALFDSGTSRLHFGLWDRGRLVGMEHSFYPESTGMLEDIIREFVKCHDLNGAIAASVSNRWREPLFQAIRSAVPGPLREIRTAADIGIRVPYAKPETYGIDRALAALAAWHRFGASCVVADAGTALTIDAVAPDGSIAGGFILPGFHVQAAALASATGLPEVAPGGESSGPGRSTEECIAKGILKGFRAAARELVRQADEAAGAGGRLILTGGEAGLLAGFEQAAISPGLVLEGLGLAWEKNREP